MELYDMRTDPNEWTNLADRPESRAVKEAMSRAHPARKAPLARKSRYNINRYWRKKTAEAK